MGESGKRDRDSIQADFVEILKDMTSDWDIDYEGGIQAKTRMIADLGFESIDIVQLIVAIEERFGQRTLPFEKLLMKDGRYVDEITVDQAVSFLHEHLN